MKYLDFRSKYNLNPTIDIASKIWTSKDSDYISEIMKTNPNKMVIECYPGTNYEKLNELLLSKTAIKNIVKIDDIAKPIETINRMFEPNLTNDRVFGVMSNFVVEDLYYSKSISTLQNQFDLADQMIVYGFGASLIQNADIILYIDISRWEIQLRYRYENAPNWNMTNFNDEKLAKYKRGYFIEWRIADRVKTALFDKIDYYFDGNNPDELKMMLASDLTKEIANITKRPFRLKPYFDPGVWGGQWMKEVCNLDDDKINYAWCFDCVPEENSVVLENHNKTLEMPAINIILLRPIELLGQYVYKKFGAEFPIRFDFLDTMEGQNLSLQVHPLKSYIKDTFNMKYTQDESYYIMDSTEDSKVYLGVQTGVQKEELIEALKNAQKTNEFDASKFVNTIPVKKHDHILIPSGTIHCSGANTMVLEVSSTPYIFTFKLWDWGRVDFDGKPRPIHIEHGEQVIQFDRETEWVKEHLVNDITVLYEDSEVLIERTGLHELEFIETTRYWQTGTVKHYTNDKVHVLNLVEGQQAVVESMNDMFEPFVVNYAETFIIPASVTEYTIAPHGPSIGKKIAILKATIKEKESYNNEKSI